MQYNNISERLKKLRKELNLSQTDFGRKIGKNYHSVMRWELGKVLPPSNVIEHICGTFGINTVWLTDGIGDMFTHAKASEAADKAAEYSTAQAFIPLYKDIKGEPLGTFMLPGAEDCVYAVYAPANSAPPIAEGDILLIAKCGKQPKDGIYLITDSYGDTYGRIYNPESDMWISKLSGFPDIENENVTVHGEILKIIRDIRF
ncbi:MAG: helix-turn-helix domain-containing protein [Deferribacterales bacterium]